MTSVKVTKPDCPDDNSPTTPPNGLIVALKDAAVYTGIASVVISPIVVGVLLDKYEVWRHKNIGSLSSFIRSQPRMLGLGLSLVLVPAVWAIGCVAYASQRS